MGIAGSVAQTSFMHVLDGNASTPALTGIQNANTAGLFFGSGGGGFVGVGGSNGHLAAAGASAPALSSCGATPSPALDAGSSDTAGGYTTGGTATTCTVTFGVAFAAAPSCSVDVNGTATQPTFTVSASAITVTVDIAQTHYSYICLAKSGG
jgi:hypothetical protein